MLKIAKNAKNSPGALKNIFSIIFAILFSQLSLFMKTCVEKNQTFTKNLISVLRETVMTNARSVIHVGQWSIDNLRKNSGESILMLNGLYILTQSKVNILSESLSPETEFQSKKLFEQINFSQFMDTINRQLTENRKVNRD